MEWTLFSWYCSLKTGPSLHTIADLQSRKWHVQTYSCCKSCNCLTPTKPRFNWTFVPRKQLNKRFSDKSRENTKMFTQDTITNTGKVKISQGLKSEQSQPLNCVQKVDNVKTPFLKISKMKWHSQFQTVLAVSLKCIQYKNAIRKACSLECWWEGATICLWNLKSLKDFCSNLLDLKQNFV